MPVVLLALLPGRVYRRPTAAVAMATVKKDLSGNQVQGPHDSVDLGNDVVSIDEVARRLNTPKTTLYGWRYKGKGPRGHRVGEQLALPLERRPGVAGGARLTLSERLTM